MQAAAQSAVHSATGHASSSKKSLWAGRILSGLVTAFLLLDTAMHLLVPAPVVEAFTRLGIPLHLAVALGILELICVVAYVIPRTSILGAILLTGYLGGAVATHLHAGSPLFSEALFPVYIGVLAWGGLYLRDERLRILFPWRS
jgi:hypothetical protein